MNKLIITIDPKTETVSFKVKGVKGAGCLSISDDLRRGSEIIEQHETEELHEVNVEQVAQR